MIDEQKVLDTARQFMAAELLKQMGEGQAKEIMIASIAETLGKITLGYELKETVKKTVIEEIRKLMREEPFKSQIEEQAKRALQDVMNLIRPCLFECFLKVFTGVDEYNHSQLYKRLFAHAKEIGVKL